MEVVNICPEPGDEPGSVAKEDIFWLAGLLEGEGCFTLPSPGAGPRIVIETTDEDIAVRVGQIFERKVTPRNSSRQKRNGWQPTWRVSIAGKDAQAWMRVLYPMMSARRQERIAMLLEAGPSQVKVLA